MRRFGLARKSAGRTHFAAGSPFLRGRVPVFAFAVLGLSLALKLSGQNLLEKLGDRQPFQSKRVSSFDRTGGNSDAIPIEPGKTVELAAISGPAAIHHIWVTIAAEPFYGRKIVLRIYWDGEEVPSVEAPIGDFFAVGHGLNRNLSSLPIANSSAGRARNCYWYMPFRWSCRITATNEGTQPVAAFYYYIDYRELVDIKPDAPYFHAQYRQEFPCEPGRNYLILDAVGAGHYVGCTLSVLQRSMGWWGEGDDMIFVDGETSPSLHGTGSEDYFSDAWGMREDENLFYGCPLQEDDFQAGSKATVYRFHIADPIPFTKTIRVTIEHGHANDRADHDSSVAYWYQTEPHVPFPQLPTAEKRLPFALASQEGFIFPNWEEVKDAERSVFEDKAAGLRFAAAKLNLSQTSYYDARGTRYPALTTEGAAEGTKAELTFPVVVPDLYTVNLYLLKGPALGNFHALRKKSGVESVEAGFEALGTFEGFAPEKQIVVLSLKNVLLDPGPNTIIFDVAGRDARAAGLDIALVGLSLGPAERRFATRWTIIGPFEAADMSWLTVVYPPENETDLAKIYPGKANAGVGWKAVQAEPSGYLPLAELVQPNEQAVVYALAYVLSPDDRRTYALVGSDDGVRLWINDALVHTNPAYRAASPDQDRVPVILKKGWNKVLLKVLQGAGGWGFFFRFADPKEELRWDVKPPAR
jgi:hypothetical protein